MGIFQKKEPTVGFYHFATSDFNVWLRSWSKPKTFQTCTSKQLNVDYIMQSDRQWSICAQKWLYVQVII